MSVGRDVFNIYLVIATRSGPKGTCVYACPSDLPMHASGWGDPSLVTRPAVYGRLVDSPGVSYQHLSLPHYTMFALVVSFKALVAHPKPAPEEQITAATNTNTKSQALCAAQNNYLRPACWILIRSDPIRSDSIRSDPRLRLRTCR